MKWVPRGVGESRNKICSDVSGELFDIIDTALTQVPWNSYPEEIAPLPAY